MYYIVSQQQYDTLCLDLSSIGEPPLLGHQIANVIAIETLHFTNNCYKKYAPYTSFGIPPTTQAVFGDILGNVGGTVSGLSELGGTTPPHTHIEYAPVGHDHNTDYSPVTHTHDPNYSPIGHDHDIDYAPIGHTHTPAPHDHDLLYAPISHVDDNVLHANTILAPFTFTIEGNGMSGNWFTAATRSGIPSNLAPGVAVANCILQAAMFSNELDNANFQIDFYVNGGPTVAYSWSIPGARYGYKIHDETNMPPDLMLNQGDRLSLRVGTVTTNAKDGFLILYFALIDDPPPGEFFSATL